MYLTGTLTVNIQPNIVSPARNLTVCIKPFRDFFLQGQYVQRFSLEQGGLSVEATPQQDISRKATGFQY
ncbi:hypothetical protein A6R68_09383 [Neotoma lepida]|uniref:Meteorin-like protein n=1 Tax=Neotoma lepida TaxID=56216 RepID=A0A1A6G102_NEOLE|nr:hypothetical protein A6R68_09383 [Neotoma lepida]